MHFLLYVSAWVEEGGKIFCDCVHNHALRLDVH